MLHIIDDEVEEVWRVCVVALDVDANEYLYSVIQFLVDII